MLLIGCKQLDLGENITFGSNNGLNSTTAPLGQFCKEINMTLFGGNLFQLTGCLDNKGEIHYYKYDYNHNKNLWIVGNKEYEPIWTSS